MTQVFPIQKVIFSGIFLFCICFALFLGYIDEGYNSFEFLRDPGSIVALFIYAFLTAIPALIVYVIGKKLKTPNKILAPICFTALFVFPILMFALLS